MSNKNDVNKVSFGKPKIGGAIFSAPLGTELPTDATTDLNAAFKNLGYASQDGLKNTNTASTESVKAWGGDTVLVTQTEKPDIFNYSLIEATNLDVLKEVYGPDNVTGDLKTGITIRANAEPAEPHVIVVDMILNQALKRIVIPNGVVSEVGEITYVDGGAIAYPTTLKALPNEKGDTHYEYIQSTTKAV